MIASILGGYALARYNVRAGESILTVILALSFLPAVSRIVPIHPLPVLRSLRDPAGSDPGLCGRGDPARHLAHGWLVPPDTYPARAGRPHRRRRCRADGAADHPAPSHPGHPRRCHARPHRCREAILAPADPVAEPERPAIYRGAPEIRRRYRVRHQLAALGRGEPPRTHPRADPLRIAATTSRPRGRARRRHQGMR